MLETIYLIFRKTIVQRVTVVEPGVYDGQGEAGSPAIERDIEIMS